ncbi:MAG: geranyl-CoA carboxylase subunit apha [Candidatus Pelagadaptatus aseana]|uniref:acetyl/propionyl/methylcrotonyl-CoA carboxylase subunit alpha n=1 Tax=Candidatus Pelagadaptatus aseana TaxID=3120508 RepID=UPI0039B26974
MAQFDSILVANRGEIAVRVISSAKQQGYRTIAVYSEADAGAPHVQMADEAVLIGAAAVKESYLDPAKILDAAQKTGAQAIHPGYGFLSENADFAKACEEAGITFIGPSAESIDIMGNKAASKRRMLDADVPCIPGYQDEDQSDEVLLKAAQEIGVPIMVKAAAGGGGRGMRLVTDMNELETALKSARSEAENAFGSGELILEKAVMEPRHVEVQVFGDSHGNAIHLGERDCSVQRRHQKVVEESPCPVMTPELREAMGTAAVNAAKSINYLGAGTVEFLLDADNNFYFLEMNTRLQVEHPVTEMVTGQDLVAMQFKVAQGYPLPITQEQVALTGHAIEVRLYAEDTLNDFLPASGTAQTWLPPTGEGIRVDHGLLQGQDVSPFYDPMIAKIIAWGEDRDIARRRLVRALQNTSLFGLTSNREFLIDVLDNPCFASGEATTAFIEQEFAAGPEKAPATDEHLIAAAFIQYQLGREDSVQSTNSNIGGLGYLNAISSIATQFEYDLDEDNTTKVNVQSQRGGELTITVNGQDHQVSSLGETEGTLRLLIDKVQKDILFSVLSRGEVGIQINGNAQVLKNNLAYTKGDETQTGSGSITAPMHGNLFELMVKVGDTVEAGDDVAIMEAMKMEHRLKAQVSGTVAAINANVGDQVASGVVILEIEEAE